MLPINCALWFDQISPNHIRAQDLFGFVRDALGHLLGGAQEVAGCARLAARDIRKLVASFDGTNEPALTVRQHVVLVNFSPVRAVVLRDRCILLLPDGADEMLAPFLDVMQAPSGHEGKTTMDFEFLCLEAVLLAFLKALERALGQLSNEAAIATKQLHRRAANGPLERLRIVKDEVRWHCSCCLC